MIVAYDEDYITQYELNEFRFLYKDSLKLLNGYIGYLKKAKTGYVKP
jgi:hypothetical protein